MESTTGKVIRCKAAVCRNAGEALGMEEVEVEPPRAGEVRIKIICTSLCHTDTTFWKMNSGPASLFPRIFGHEAVGVVESVGEGVDEVKEGEMVVPVFLADCGECRDCASPNSNICSKFNNRRSIDMQRDGTSRFRDSEGGVIHHFLGVSSFVEYTVVDITHIVKINPLLPPKFACLLSCGVSTGIGAAWKVADVEEGSTVVIFGLGAVGLAVAEGARLRGASKIIGVDLNPDKFEMGKKFGVTDFVNPADCGEERPISQVIKEMTEGGADYSFECIGLASLMTQAFDSTREGSGKTIILGIEMHGTSLTLNPYEIIRGRSVVGAFLGGVKPKSDIPLFADKLLNKELNLDNFISHELSFDDINEAFDLLLQGKSLRCIIWMDKQKTIVMG